MKTLVCIPTFNGGRSVTALIASLKEQDVQPDRLLVIDSSSNDRTVDLFQTAGAEVHIIPRTEFNHGATRQSALLLVPDADVLCFLTQDAVFARPDALRSLLRCFDDDRIGSAYGRQLPRAAARSIESHARLFNYPPSSMIKDMSFVQQLGIKTAFTSNSFAAYRRSALEGVGGFPSNTILCEDIYVAAKMLLAGWKIAYCSDATVYHSHWFGFLAEFRRYFDIGVFHARERWILDRFGGAGGEGLKFVLSELRYLAKRDALSIPSALFRNVLKYLAYRIGLHERYVPRRLKHHLSGHDFFFSADEKTT